LRRAAVVSGRCQSESGILIRSLARPVMLSLLPPPGGFGAWMLGD
jgi:hypothetical protein